jgi:hypothetical protein
MTVGCVSKKCPNCNITISEEMKFCGNCGAKLKFKDGEIFNHVLNLEKLHNIKIAWIDYVTALPNNTKVGIITLSDGRNALFYGNEIINKIGGKVIDFVSYLYFRQDSLLAGVLFFRSGFKNLLFIGDKIFDEIAGIKIKKVKDVWLRPNGELAGSFYPDIKLPDGIRDDFEKLWFLFSGNSVIEREDKKPMAAINKVTLMPNGELAGTFSLYSPLRYIPFIGNRIIEKIGDKTIEFCNFIPLDNNTLAGEVILSDYSDWLIFIGEKLINKIGGKDIKGVRDLYFLSNGICAGIIETTDKQLLPFKQDNLLEKIEGKNIEEVYDVQLLPNGDLIGTAKFFDGSTHVFINNKILEKLGNKEIRDIRDVFVLPNGIMTGIANIDSKWHLFIGDQIIEFEHTEKLKEGGPLDVKILPNGELMGNYCTGFASRCVPFKGNKVLEEIAGEEIKSASVDPLPDNTLSGGILFSKGQQAGLLWHGTKLKVTYL